MPFEDTRLLSTLTHTFWFLPSVSSCYAMKNLLSNEKKLIDLGEKAKERAINSFTWEKVARKYILAIKNNN